MVPVLFTILGSGSGGNCAYLEAGETRLLIDAGFSARQIRERLSSIGRAPESLSGILITHEHSDHVQGLSVLAAKTGVPVYCNRLTRDAILTSNPGTFVSKLFNTGDSFAVGDVEVETFSIPHDAQDPVGFLLRTGSGNIGFLTDLGHASRMVVERVRPAHALVLETNYDLRMLQEDTRRPWSLKQRIASRHGHLSNDAAANTLRQIMHDGLQTVYMAHMSRDCNRPELAQRALSAAVELCGATHVELRPTSQDKPCATQVLSAVPSPCSNTVPP
ncbi:MAG: MBL fold metallo-hydrolase [Verrucomicrobia bacterium]|nr:MBL fold metallo-hydrolase [Verrucomicrobiota bacterium]